MRYREGFEVNNVLYYNISANIEKNINNQYYKQLKTKINYKKFLKPKKTKKIVEAFMLG
jgi:hypothetical protein